MNKHQNEDYKISSVQYYLTKNKTRKLKKHYI